MKKPDKIYEEEIKKFKFEKPEGWDRKPPKQFKMKWWQILKDGLAKKDMEPKYFFMYEGWMHELKVIMFTVFFTICITYIVFHSPFITTSAMNEKENEKETLFDRGLDYVLGKYDEWRGITPSSIVVKPDTIYQVVKDTIPAPVPLLTQEQLDSIIKSYKLDSIQKVIDSTN